MTGTPTFVQPAAGLTCETAHLYYTVAENGCWVFRCIPERTGYTRIRVHGRRQNAHRAFYELFVGPIPIGLHIDHLCSVRNCVNPDHLEAVTHAENNRRVAMNRTHCAQGHAFDAANTYRYANGRRYCRTCGNESHRRRALKQVSA